jgi:hypothetical protein
MIFITFNPILMVLLELSSISCPTKPLGFDNRSTGFFLTDVPGTIQITLKQLSRSQAPAFFVPKLELGNENQI